MLITLRNIRNKSNVSLLDTLIWKARKRGRWLQWPWLTYLLPSTWYRSLSFIGSGVGEGSVFGPGIFKCGMCSVGGGNQTDKVGKGRSSGSWVCRWYYKFSLPSNQNEYYIELGHYHAEDWRETKMSFLWFMGLCSLCSIQSYCYLWTPSTVTVLLSM